MLWFGLFLGWASTSAYYALKGARDIIDNAPYNFHDN